MDETDLNTLMNFVRDRFDSQDRRLDEMRGAMELWTSSINQATIKLVKHQGRIQKVEDWIKRHGKIAEHREDVSFRRRDRIAILLSGLFGAVATFGLSLITGVH